MKRRQQRRTEEKLRRYCDPNARYLAEGRLWGRAIEETMAYYSENDPLRADLLRMRYSERRRVEEVTEQLNISDSTYERVRAEVLSTVAICVMEILLSDDGLRRQVKRQQTREGKANSEQGLFL